MKPMIKRNQIIAYYRDAILNDQLNPGDRLPIREEIVEQFQASSVTVQRAFDQLMKEGYLKSHGKRGTFVAQHLPHHCRYAFAFPDPVSRYAFNQFVVQLEQCARTIESEEVYSFTSYYAVDDHVDGKGLRALSHEVDEHRLAGAVFIGKASLKVNNPVLQDKRLVRILLSAQPIVPPGFHLVELGEPSSYMNKAVEYLISRGRKRIAFFSNPGIEKVRLNAFYEVLLKKGLKTDASYMQSISPEFSQWGANLTQLMFNRAPAERPDALIIDDENLLDHVCAGLIQAGINVPEDLDVVAHANFPVQCPNVIPVVRLGYDVPAILQKCVEIVDAKRRYMPVETKTVIPPHFEWELGQES